jgi:Flp pilus assembly protein TadG
VSSAIGRFAAALSPMTRNANKSRSGSFRQGRRGASVLELLLVLPILLMLSFGAVDYGYVMFVKNTLEGAAETGARAGIPPTATNASVTSAVSNVMTAAGLTTYTVSITDTSNNPLNVSGLAAGTMIQVTVSCTWANVGTHALGSAWGGISNTKVVTGTTVMQKESN